jgi:hypothetical protein
MQSFNGLVLFEVPSGDEKAITKILGYQLSRTLRRIFVITWPASAGTAAFVDQLLWKKSASGRARRPPAALMYASHIT